MMSFWRCKPTNRQFLDVVYFTTMYFTQGLLYGFQTRFLPLFLRDQGLSFSAISFVRLLTLPCLMKSAWAPYIDRTWRTYDWVAINFTGNFFCLVFVGLATSYAETPFFVAVFAMNVFTATQDVALAKAMMYNCVGSESRLLKASCCKVLGYKVGNLFGGGIVVWLATLHHQATALINYLAFFHLLLGCLISRKAKWFYTNTKLLLIKFRRWLTTERTDGIGMKNKRNALHLEQKYEQLDSKPYESSELPSSTPTNIMAKFSFEHLKSIAIELLSDYRLLWMAVFAFFYRLGPQAGHALFSFYLLDNGVPLWQVGILIGVYSQCVNICASALGGLCLSSNRNVDPFEVLPYDLHYLRYKVGSDIGGLILRVPLEHLQCVALVVSLVPVLLQLLIIMKGGPAPRGHVLISISLEQVCFGLSSTAIQAMMLQDATKSDRTATSLTGYTFLVTLESLGKLTSSATALIVASWLGYSTVYTLSLVLIVLSWVLFYWRPSDRWPKRGRANVTIVIQPRKMTNVKPNLKV